LAARAWQQFLHSGNSGGGTPDASAPRDPFDAHKVDNADVPATIDEIRNASTNATSQWCLNAIELLEMVGKEIPPDDPRWSSATTKP
ncbi:MAG TPA: hypothetical protein VLI90_00310, partial [Tepidisphaeraceae bacterium]|nr:hypothetical protein [Tepidisphaeraceae bacterium]